MGNAIKGITVEIGGDTTKLGKALETVNKDSSALQKELKGVNTLLKSQPGNITLIEQKQRILNESIENTKKKLETLKSTQGQVQKAFDEGKITEQQYRDFQREIISTENKLKSLSQEAKNFGNNMSPSLKSSTEKMKEFGTKIDETGKKLTSTGKTISAKVTVPIVGLGTACTTASITFEDAMAKFASLMDKNEVSVSDMKKAVMELSTQTGISASEIAEAGYTAISSGASTAQSLNVVKSAAILAKTGFTDLATAMDLSTSVMNAYGLSADSLGHISDVLNVTQDKGKTTIGDLGESMGNVIPTAVMYGVNLEQLSAGYAALTKNAIQTSQAGVAINAVLSELGKSGTKASDILKEKTGKSFQELMASGMELTDVLSIVDGAAKESGLSIGDIFSNKNAIKGASSLIQHSSDFKSSLEAINNTSGITDDKLNQLQTTGGGLKKALNDLKNDAIQFGDIITPLVAKVGELIRELAQKIGSLTGEQKKTIVQILAVAASVGPVMIIIGSLCGSISKIITLVTSLMGSGGALAGVISALGGPVGIAIGVIAALVAAMVYLYNTNESVKNALNGAWESIKNTFSSAWESVKPTLSQLWESLKNLWVQLQPLIALIGACIAGLVSIVIGVVNGIIQSLAPLLSAFSNVIDMISNWVGMFKALFTGDFSGAIEYAKAILGNLKDFIVNIFNAGWQFIQGFWSGAWETIKTVCSMIGVNITEVLANLGTKIKEFFANIVNSVKEWGMNIANKAKEIGSSFISGILGFFETLPDKIKSFIDSIFASITTFGVNMKNKAIEIGTNFINGIISFFSDFPHKVGFFIGLVITNVVVFAGQMIQKAQEIGSNFVNSIVNFFTQLPGKIAGFISNVYNYVVNWGNDMGNKAKETGSNFINSIVNFFTQLPGNIANFISNAYNSVVSWGNAMINKAIEVGSNFINNVINFFTQLPGNIWNALCNVVNNVTSWGSNLLNSGINAAQSFVDSVYNTICSLPEKMINIGRNIVEGIWNGISNAKDWLLEQIGSFADGIVDGVKSALGIHSPSRVMRDEVGKYMAQGIGIGFTGEMDNVNTDINTSVKHSVEISKGNLGSGNSSNLGDSLCNALIKGLEGISLQANIPIGINKDNLLKVVNNSLAISAKKAR